MRAVCRFFLSALLLLLVSITNTFTNAAPVPNSHPRLILTPSRLSAVKDFISNDTQAAAYFTSLHAQGEYLLNTKPFPRPPANATQILTEARTVLIRCYVTSLLWQLSGNTTYAERAFAEVSEIITWSDWNIVNHALDAGELCHASSIANDWI